MKKGYTEIVMVLDRSTSMHSVKDATIEGVNAFLLEQKKVEGKCNFTMHQFDTGHEKIHLAEDIQKVPMLDNSSFIPQGCTALLDAIGMCIDETGKRLREMSESERPDNVMFVVMTDGEENSSREYSKNQITDMITDQTDKYSWDFVFLAANQDAIASGATMGFNAGKSLSFSTSTKGMANTMDSVAAYCSNVRSGNISAAASNFSAEDRDAAMED